MNEMNVNQSVSETATQTIDHWCLLCASGEEARVANGHFDDVVEVNFDMLVVE